MSYFKRIYQENDDGSLKHDYRPCIRKDDGVFGLYDIVNKEFYPCTKDDIEMTYDKFKLEWHKKQLEEEMKRRPTTSMIFDDPFPEVMYC